MNHWPTSKLGDVARIRRGASPRPKGDPRYFGGNIPWLKIGDVAPGSRFISKTEDTVTPAGRDLSVYVEPGTLLLSNSASVGRPVINQVAVCIHDGWLALDKYETTLRREFLFWFFTRSQADFQRLAQSGTQKNLNIGIVSGLAVPVPPMAEQDRIVTVLDKADELRNLRAQADLRTANLISALFHEMFGQQAQTPPVLISPDGATTPKGWRWVRLTDVARLATGHTPSRRVPEYWEDGQIPWISLTDIRALDGTVAQATSESVTETGIENSSAVKLPKGTVCFSRTASVGFVTVMGREMCTSQDFVNWVCGDDLNPIYLMGALMQAREYLRSLASGSTHKTIYFPTVEQFSVLVPPLPLQEAFALRATKIREVEAVQAASRRRLDALFQSMLHRAFNGEL